MVRTISRKPCDLVTTAAIALALIGLIAWALAAVIARAAHRKDDEDEL